MNLMTKRPASQSPAALASPTSQSPNPEQANSKDSHAVAARQRIRLLYALGPGDVVGMYRDLLQGLEPPFEMSIAFSRLFLDWCDEVGAEAHLMSWHTRRDSIRVDRYNIENRPKRSPYYKPGIRHHIGSVAYGLTVIKEALRERPDAVIVDSGTTHWIVLAMLSIFRIPVIAVMHSTLWPTGYPPARRIHRLLRAFDGVYFRRFAAATVCVSPECERQVRMVATRTNGPVYQCRAQFQRGSLSNVDPAPPHSLEPFRVLFVGRIEEYKGVFLIVSIAERLEKEMPGRFIWKLVGGGPALESLRSQVTEKSLSNVVEVAGRLPRDRALEAYGWAHAMVVPTTAAYSEGLAMTAAEAVLAGRPVVLSEVVPAWEILGDAAIRAKTGDVDSFVEAFRRLASDSEYYNRCRSATVPAQTQFYSTSQGLGATLGRAIYAVTGRSHA
jgi:glycogen synthase